MTIGLLSSRRSWFLNPTFISLIFNLITFANIEILQTLYCLKFFLVTKITIMSTCQQDSHQTHTKNTPAVIRLNTKRHWDSPTETPNPLRVFFFPVHPLHSETESKHHSNHLRFWDLVLELIHKWLNTCISCARFLCELGRLECIISFLNFQTTHRCKSTL